MAAGYEVDPSGGTAVRRRGFGMTIRLADLTPEQASMLAYLDTGRIDPSAAGLPVDEHLMRMGFRVADELMRLELIEIADDAPASDEPAAWYRLTLLGRQVRDEGAG